MSDEIHRDLGRHDAQIEAMQGQIKALSREVDEVLKQLVQINQTLSEAKGGWKTLLAVGGFASAITAIAIKVKSWIQALPIGR